jgi:hypothetical protein
VVPFAIEALAPLIVMDRNVAAVTVSVIELDVMPFWVALIALLPVERPLANPLAVMVATAAFEEFQVTEFVRFWVLPSVKVPVALN